MPAYFCKVSYMDPTQPLVRHHANVEITVDLVDDMWRNIHVAQAQIFGLDNFVPGFTIDFMIEIPPKG
jgi:hypothetical protein